MAEYKLGRIKFVYQGAWASSTAYVVDDVVTVGGKTYICIVSNTSSAIFATDLSSNYWSIVADGTRWTGTWANATYYQLGDQVLYGGIVYQATTAHTSASATATLTATGFTVSAGTATLTYASQVVQPFLVGATITLAGFSPTQTSGTVNNVNTTFTVVTCTTTQVTFALTGTYSVSTLGTVAGASQLGLEQDQAKWTAFASNINYLSAWTVNTRYKINDLVTYGGYTYLATTAHVSASTTALGLEQDQAKWSTFNPGLSYQGTWSGSSVHYRLNDIVKYGASLFICTTAHNSTATFATANFATFVNGLQYVPGGSNAWSSVTTYVVGDIVTYGGNLYIAIQIASNQNPSTASSYWSLYTSGFSYQGTWSGVSSYKIGQVVSLGGYTYLALADNTQNVLTAQATTVTTNIITLSATTTALVANLPVVFGSTFGGLTAGQTYYVIGSSITSNTFQVSTVSGSGVPVTLSTTTGQSVTVTTQSQPPFATYWSKLNSGVSYKPTTGTYTAVSATNVTGSGSSATFNVTATKTTYSVTLNGAGTGYSATGGSNTIKILGSSLGGLSPANDITITITGVSTGAISTFTYVGYSVTWATSVTYVLGDVVYFGSNSYICVSGHVSASGNRPDADTTGTYWNLLAAGNESAVLTVTGDLFYYGANGPTRLPIGTDGQVLRVNAQAPSWAYYGQINNIVYVSSATGIDVLTNSQGTTIDKPWKTIQYACQQVEAGYLNTNLGNLIQINKQFLLKEVNNFVLYNYTFNITATTVTTNVITVGGSSTIAQTTTANLYSNMPISFAVTAGGLTAGTTYYVIGASITSTTFQVATIPSTSGTQTAVTLSTTATANLGQYVYSQSKTERDTGLVVDGLIFDITHGGNSKTIANGLSYFTSTGTSYVSGVAAYDISPFVKALNYLNTLITTNVSANTAPSTNYQTTISPAVTVTGASGTGAVATITFAAQSYAYAVGSQITVASINPSGYNGTFVVLSSTTTSVSYANTTTSSYVSGGTVNYTRAVQQINTSYVAETSAVARVSVLVGYVTTPLSVGNTTPITGILANASTTISIKTGTYNEVLPIVVPSYTVIFGDELRSSTVQPAVSTLTLVNDKPKTIAALTRIQTQLPNLLQNTSIAGSANNTQYLTISAASGTGSVATLTFATQATAPFTTGQYITISGFTSTAAGYNGSYAVTACTTTSVSYSNATSAASSGSPIASGQNTQLAVADVGSATAVNTINTFTSSINNMIFNGLSQVPAISITTVTGYNTSFLPGHSTGVTQITSNYAFIKAELTAYMNTNYNSVWSGLGTAGQQLYLLQIQYILDGMQYDMAYGCNNQSLINGSSYYSLNLAQVLTASQPAYLATFQRLQAIVGQIVRAQSVAATSGNGVTQTTGSDAGAGPAAFASARIADVIYWFSNGSANSTVNTITGSISGTTLTVTTQTSAVSPGTLLTGTGINGMYIVNQISSSAGASAATTYSSGGGVGTSTFVVSSATGIAAGQFITGTGIPAGTYVASTYVSASTTVPIANFFGSPVTFTVQASGAYLFYSANTAGTYTLSITGGTGTAFTTLSTFNPVQSGAYTLVGSNALQFAYTQLQARATEIASDAQAFVAKYNQQYNISSTLTNRDAGLIVNALSFDVLFTTNANTIAVGRAFNRTNTSAQALLSNTLNELYATTAAINFIGFKAKMIAAAGGQVQAQTLIDDIIYRINGQATTTLTTATTSTNVLTVSSTSAMSVNQPITFTGLPANINTTVSSTLAAFAGSITTTTATALTGVGTITSNGAGSFTFGTPQSAGTFYAGQVLTVTGSLSGVTWTGYVSGNSYVVQSTTNGTSQVTLTTVTGAAISVTTGTATGITFNTYLATITTTGLVVGSAVALTGTSFGGLSAGTYYVIGFGPTASASMALSSTAGGNSVAMTSSSGTLIAQTTTNLLNIGGYVSTLGITTGQQCYFSGAVYAGVTPYQLYYIVSASGTGITVSTTSGGGAITVGTTSGSMTLTVNAAGGIWPNNQYYINTIPSGTTLTITANYKSGTAYTITNTATSMSATSTFGPTATVLYYNSPMIHGSTTYNDTVTTINAAEIIRANIGFLGAEASAYVGASYGGSVSSTAATTNLITTSGNHNFTVGDPVQFSGSVVGGLSASTTYWVLTVNSNTTFTVSLTQASQGTQTAVVLSNTSSAFTVNYYNTAQTYVTSILNGIVYDLQYTGNNRSLRAVEIYNNAISGSTISNMFLVRNGSGIRNMTMSGITGVLSAANAYGTKRPTGGAYTSLDPGFGPNDTNVQILSRSTYVQNCTMFGYAAVGAKVDGALHSAGYKSIVANDYTCVIGDGIGWWNTGTGSLAELVSVFNYYSYAGYLAELGGRLRATNGNSSYGTYGVIAESTDTFETPIYATLNNRAAPAQVTNVVTDSTTQILRFEYGNAGINYTNSVPTVNGSGYNAVAFQDEYRDAAVFETRLIDPNNTGLTGGTSYVSAVNVGQVNARGPGYQLIAAADSALSSTYNGMNILVTAGTGVGQYATVLTYDNSSKYAQIIRPTFKTLSVTASTTTTATTSSSAIIATYAGQYPTLVAPVVASGTFVAGMFLTSSGTITAGTYITAINTGTITTASIASSTFSSTGTIGASITGSGTAASPWVATITGMSSTSGFVVGAQITATNGTGTLYGSTPTSVIVTSIPSTTSITYSVIGGTIPTTGTITNVQQTMLSASAFSNLLPGMVLSGGSVIASYVAGQVTATGTALATATFTGTIGTSTLTLTSFTVGSTYTVQPGQFVGQISGIPAGTYVTAVNPGTGVITINTTLYGAVSGSTSTYTAGGAGTYALTANSFTTITGTPTNGTQTLLNTAQTQIAATITGTQNTLTVGSNATLYNTMPIYLGTAVAPLSGVAIGSSGAITFTTTTTALPANTQVVVSGANVGTGVVATGTFFVAASPTPTATGVTLLTATSGGTAISTTAGTVVTSGNLASVNIGSSGNLTFTALGAALPVGTPVVISGSNGGSGSIANGTYYVAATPTPTTSAVTLVTTSGGSTSPTTTAGTPSGLTFAFSLVNPLTFTYTLTAPFGLTSYSTYYVQGVTNTAGVPSTTFSVTTTSNGTSPTAVNTITGQTVSLYAAGWDHVVPGTAINNTTDLTTAYIIEPAVTYSAPGYTQAARTLQTSASYTGVAYGSGNYVAISTGATTTQYSTNGRTWANGGALPSTAAWNAVTYGGGQGGQATVTVGGFGGSGAVLTANVVGGQVTSITIVNGGFNYNTVPTITITPVGAGAGATATCTVLNGAITTVTMTINGSGYTTGANVAVVTSSVSSVTPITWGKNYGYNSTAPSVTLSAPFSGTVWSSGGSGTSGSYYYFLNTGVTPNVTNYYQATSTGTFTTSGPTHTSGTVANGTVNLLYVGTQAVVTPTLTNTGISSYAVTVAGFGYTTVPTITIADLSARFVAISPTTAGANVAPTGVAGAWNSMTTPSAGYNAIAYGVGQYVVVGGTGGAGIIASSGDGSSWSARTVPAAAATQYFSAIAYGSTGTGLSGNTTTGLFIAIPTYGNIPVTSTNGSTWAIPQTGGGANVTLPASLAWSSIAYGNGRFVAIASNSTSVAYTINGGGSWNLATVGGGAGLPGVYSWSSIAYGEGQFVVVAANSNVSATSWDGINWTVQTLPATQNWSSITFGNPLATTIGYNPLFVAVANTAGTTAAVIHTGATPLGRVKVLSNAVSEVRMIEPGSGFAKGNVTATTAGTNVITADNIEGLQANQPVEFNTVSSGGLSIQTTYYVIGSSITTTVAPAGTFQVSTVSGSTTPVTLTTTAPTGMTYTTGPIVTITDPNRINAALVRVRTGDGVLGNPSFPNRGAANATATASQAGDGYSDIYQTSTYVNVSNLYQPPTAGANVQFASISNTWYKLVAVTNLLGVAGNYTATFQINPGLSVYLAPATGNLITTRLKYSQVRLTGHDFLYIGTGNQTLTNYPNVVPSNAISANQTLNNIGGRTFFTSTDQDGNFNVGNLFGVQQATGTASLNASAFNLAGLQSLTLGSVTVGIGSATITSFSTDPYFTANSDNIVPTQKAIKSYITAQIGGGSSSLNVNTLTAGVIFVGNNQIYNTTGYQQIYVSSKMLFTGGIDGAPVALTFFAQR
jgi:hypothetical protein